ncbi:Cell differentiation protein RCD1 [Datura stramonium]|uniref:Cell differentiation protein RCD1 n=1 Tax=Datura stramonium TaxID=4076 RepID=A0ABS8V3R5_DATST|nr:Cell differentiation protein RCD1 [Datura stramonium]
MENLPESPFSETISTSSSLLCNTHSSPSSPMVTQQNSVDLDTLAPNQLVLLLHDANLREKVIDQLIKKQDSCKDLAPLVWNTFNAVYMLLMEVIAVYWNLSPSKLSMKESTRACNALALFQVMANNPETRRELIQAKIPCYFYPFLKPSRNDKPLEYLRLTSLGVLGSLTKFDDQYGPMVLHFFMKTEVLPLCLACMDQCDELSRKVATLIVMKILMQVEGLTYCSATAERFYSMVQDDHETSWMLQVLHFNIYGRLNFLQYEDSYNIAQMDTTVQKAKKKK